MCINPLLHVFIKTVINYMVFPSYVTTAVSQDITEQYSVIYLQKEPPNLPAFLAI